MPPGAMVTSGLGLPPGTMSESVRTSTAHSATKDHKDAQCLGCNLWPCLCPRAATGAMLICVACAAILDFQASSRPKLLLKAMSRSLILQQRGSVLMSMS